MSRCDEEVDEVRLAPANIHGGRRAADRWSCVGELLLRARDVGALRLRVVACRKRTRVGDIHKALVVCVVVLIVKARRVRQLIEGGIVLEELMQNRCRVRFDLVNENGHEVERLVVVIAPRLRINLFILEQCLILL